MPCLYEESGCMRLMPVTVLQARRCCWHSFWTAWRLMHLQLTARQESFLRRFCHGCAWLAAKHSCCSILWATCPFPTALLWPHNHVGASLLRL
jgi:hypothetical protein